MIKTQHLTKRYKSTLAVDDLSFRVETGKVTGFLGPNGAGKSTTMRLMLGLDGGAGTTTFDGKKLHEYDRPSQVVGILLEAKAFHPTRTAREHLRVLAIAGGISKQRVDEALAAVGLTSVADKGPGKFSLGMSQRLGIAAAILGQPKYLILDEPGNGLDPEGIAWLREFLKAYAAQGNAVLVSSHLLSEMALLADNVVVIGKGKLIADTAMSELLNQSSKDVFVRTKSQTALKRVLTAANYDITAEAKGFIVHGKPSDKIGELLADKGLAVLELSPRRASLEDVFLQITAGSEEYVAAAPETKTVKKEGK